MSERRERLLSRKIAAQSGRAHRAAMSLRRWLLGSLLLAGCHPQSIDPLEVQPKLKPYRESDFFADGRSMRTPPLGTVPRERELQPKPGAPTAELLALGKEKFEITCAVCHGLDGSGSSLVAQKMGVIPPPSLHEARFRTLTADDLYRIVTEGYGVMPRYSTILDAHERWAVVAYVRALQFSRYAPVDEVGADVVHKVETEANKPPPAPEHEGKKEGKE